MNRNELNQVPIPESPVEMCISPSALNVHEPSLDPVSVSVIVPAYNEEQSIHRCLASLLRQTVPCDIIVVDDGSSDGTPRIVQLFPSVRLLQQRHQGPGNARNLGARYAKGAILVFCDADQEFSPCYVEMLIRPIVQNAAVGTYSREEYIANYDNVWARCYNIDAEIYDDSRHRPDIPESSPVFRALPRRLFLSAGGYDDVGYGEDCSISNKLGQLAMPAPGAVCYHYNPSSLKEVFVQAQWYGKGLQVDKGWRKMLSVTPPLAAIGSLKRAYRTRTPHFVIYKVVHSTGVLVGIIHWHLSSGNHAR